MQNNGAISFKAVQQYMPAMDGMRAISILLVVISHLGFGNIIPGGFGVTIFFFLSGFLIARLLIAEQNQNNGHIDLKAFYIRRFLRLMPAMYFYVFFVIVVSSIFFMQIQHSVLMSALFYYVNYYDALAPIMDWPIREVPWNQLWSLAVEEHFYLIFPASLLLFGRTQNKRLAIVVFAILLGAFGRYFDLLVLKLPGEYTYQTSECRMENIAWGCMLAILLDGVDKIEKPKLQKIVGFNWLVIGIAMILFTIIYRDQFFRDSLRYTIQGAGLFLCVLNLYSLDIMKPIIKILEFAPLRFIGRLSYSWYLWHVLVIWVATSIQHREFVEPKSILWVVPVSLWLAMISYHYVEKPFFAMRKKFGGHPVEEMAKKAKALV